MTVITEADVARLLDMPATIAETEHALRRWNAGALTASPRIRARHGDATLHVLPGIGEFDDGIWAGQKSYLSGSTGAGHQVTLHRLRDGASFTVEATLLGALRTGAVSAVATRHMHGPVRILAVIGAGAQARQQILAIAAGNRLEEVRVFSRTPLRTQQLVRTIAAEIDADVIAASTSAACIRGADAICTITRSAVPVLSAGDVAPGTHINAAGSNALERQEVPDSLVRDSFLAVDSREQAATEAGDLAPLIERGELDLAVVPELADIVTGQDRVPGGRTTLFESLGVGVLDLALARLVARRHEGEA